MSRVRVNPKAANRLYYLSAKIVQSVSGSLLYSTKQEFSYSRELILSLGGIRTLVLSSTGASR